MKTNEYYGGMDLVAPQKFYKPLAPERNANSSAFAKYAVALAEYETERESYNKKYSKHREAVKERANEFWVDVKEQEVPDWMDARMWKAVQNRSCNDGHSSGFDEIQEHIEKNISFLEEALGK